MFGVRWNGLSRRRDCWAVAVSGGDDSEKVVDEDRRVAQKGRRRLWILTSANKHSRAFSDRDFVRFLTSLTRKLQSFKAHDSGHFS